MVPLKDWCGQVFELVFITLLFVVAVEIVATGRVAAAGLVVDEF